MALAGNLFAFERLLCDFGQHLHRELEHRRTIHMQERTAADHAVDDRTRYAQDVAIVTVGVEM